MYILLVSATKLEIQPTIDYLQKHSFRCQGNDIDVLISGVGSISTTYLLMQSINGKRPGYILQAGIAGSFLDTYPPGSVTLISEEIVGDTGVEENHEFKDIIDMGLQKESTGPYTGKSLINPYSNDWAKYSIPLAKGLSISEITTNPLRIQQLQQKYSPGVESMEGAAFHYTCIMESIPFMQIRAVSNYVGERDKSKWKMQEAIDALNKQLVEFLNTKW
jgi:futalosine hydrolase